MGHIREVRAVLRAIRGFLALSLFLVISVSLFAQVQTATVLGSVKDPTGAVIGGASVTVTNTDTTLTRATVTEADGSYNIPALPPGNYEVRVTKDGFQTADRKGLTLEVAQNASIDITLEVGSTSQTVTVTEAAPLVDITSSSVGGTVNEDRVADLPLNGRNWTALTLLQVGVSQVNIYASAGNSPGLQGLKFSTNGAPVTSNQYLIDGGSTANQYGMTASSVTGSALGVDGIKEYKVVTVLPDASYGLSMGSQTTVVTKSGTNQFHGDAYDYLRNQSLDARNYFDVLDTANANGFGTDKSLVFPGKRIPPFRRNDFGGAIGGPIKKDKLFFYGVYEGIRERQGLSTTKVTFPTACFVNAANVLQSVIPAQINNNGTKAAVGGTQPNPYGTCAPNEPLSLPTGVASNYNAATDIITVNPQVLALADLWPQPNVVGYPTFNYSFPYLQPDPENYEQGRIDYNLGAADSLFFRYTQDIATQDAPTSFPQLPSEYHSAGQFATLGETHVFTPTILNSIRFSFGRTVDFVINLPEPAAFTAPNTLLVPSSLQSTIYGVTPAGGAFGGVSPGSGISSFATNTVAGPGNERDMFTLTEDVFWTKGKHAFKFGTLINYYQDFTGNSYQEAGSVSFANTANFFFGNWSNWTGSTADSQWRRDFHSETAGWYAQDDYRVSNRLTLNLGLRYEFTTVPTETNPADRCAFRNPGVDLTCTPGPLLQNPSYLAFSPRFGFAWDVFGTGKTSIRGGAGVYYDIGNYGYLYSSNGIGDYPLSTQIIINNTASTPPPGLAFTVPFTAVLSASSNSPNSPRLGYYTHQPGSLQRALSIDQALPWQMGLTIGYVGSQGWDIDQVREGNPVKPVGVDAHGLPIYGCWNAALTSYVTAGPTGACASGFATLGPRLNTGLAQEQLNFNEGNYYYNALQVQLNKRITQGLQFQFNYTWSKLLDNGTAGLASQGATNLYQVPQGYNTLLDRGPSVYNNTSNLRVNFIYHAPTIQSEGIVSKFANGWWFSSILSGQSGYPITPTLGSERPEQAAIYSTERPDYASTYNHSSVVVGKVSEWFDPTMFALPAAGHLGDSGRGDITGPGYAEVDFSIVKDTKARFLGEAGNIEFRAEIFNLANHANYNLPGSSLWSSGSPASAPAGQFLPAGTITSGTTVSPLAALSTAGQITSTVGTSRQIQLALKLLF